MKYGEAFKKLGYDLTVPRQDWSAEKPGGVCISISRDEIAWQNLAKSDGSGENASDVWVSKPGNKKRAVHAKKALDDYDGWIDAVIVDGEYGTSVDKATPWRPEDRLGCRWRVQSISAQGYIELRAE
ncbi:MAG: hypothetical protein H0X36_06080 [Sphingomonadaceae bacterium]|nr:hypothetical protein [Sphingomonadaceae bacterium]